MQYSCACFLEKNYFLKKYNIHVSYHGENSLSEDMKKMLLSLNVPASDFENVLKTLQIERCRRLDLGADSFKRKTKINNEYQPLHPHLYVLQESFLHPYFLKLTEYTKSSSATFNNLVEKLEECCKQVWGFPVFTRQFCDEFLQELNHFQNTDLPKGRPNTMNRYGILLNELGFDEKFLNPLRVNYLSSLSHLLFPEWTGDGLDSHKAFTVAYKENEDVDLSFHFDNAEVTLNVCLGKVFSEGELFFGDMKKESVYLTNPKKVEHKVGYGLLHRGQHMHGAMAISGTNAERHNLIIWMRSSSIRNQLCPMCDAKPRLIEQQWGGDGFSADIKSAAIVHQAWSFPKSSYCVVS